MYRILLVLIAMLVCLQGFATEKYKGPSALRPTQDGSTIYVVNRDAHEIAVLNTADDRIVRTIALAEGFFPNDAALSADEKTLYVTGGGHRGQVVAIDLETGNVAKTVAAGHTPVGLAVSPDGTKLFVANQFTTDVSEFSLPGLELTRTFKVIREPRALVVTNDGKHVLVANFLPLMPSSFPDDPDAEIYVASEISVINVETGAVRTISNLPNGSNALHGMAITPDGRYVYITAVIARYLLPTTHVERGWMNTAGVIIIDTTQLGSENGGFVNAVLIDDVDLGAANPWGVTTSADGNTIYVAVAGTSELITIDAVAMHERLEADAETRAGGAHRVAVSDNLAFLAGIKRRVRLPGKGARAVTVAGNNIYVGMYFSDTLQKLDATRLRPAEIALGPAPVWTPERRGEVWWHDATLCFQYWQSCASCHPDARTDGLNWDLGNDGWGNPKNTKSLLFTRQTPPTMWEAVRDNPEIGGWDTATMGIECIRTGFRAILFTVPCEEISSDIDAFLLALEPVPSPFLVNGRLSERAERGRVIFNDARIGCATCHPADTWYTDMQMHDVNSRAFFDRTSFFDTPTLREVWRTAPYMHDGRFVNMRDLFTSPAYHGDVSGDVGGLTDEQIDDLVEYILSL